MGNMKVTIEFSNAIDATMALQSQTYFQMIEDFELFIGDPNRLFSHDEIRDKWAFLKDLYKI